jgi:V8-like Glu-specific endopeptidase
MIQETDNDILLYALTQAFTEPGYSGSPVFTSKSELVGLIVGGRDISRDSYETSALPIMTPLIPIVGNQRAEYWPESV